MKRLESLLTRLPMRGRTLALLAALVPLLALFAYVILRSGPLSPVAVTTTTVQTHAISPNLFGIGTVEARYIHRIGPTFPGRVSRLDVQVGDRVAAGQVLGEMDAIDLDDRIRAQEASLRRADAMVREAQARQAFARTQLHRYEQLLPSRMVSEEVVASKRQELQVADAGLSAAREEFTRSRADREATIAQRTSLQLVAPTDGLVVVRDVDPGTTVVAGQAVVEIIDPHSLWIDVRFDQAGATGLAAGQLARIVLRSRSDRPMDGKVLRVEPLADAVTEETRAKVSFTSPPAPLPPVGELAEVSVALPALPAAPVIPNAAVVRRDGQLGVWQVVDGNKLRFTPVEIGLADLDGRVQVAAGLKAGDQVVEYSEKALGPRSRIHVVESIRGVAK
ncbi:efflux RND transporter periplasmic adaptor subunit [Thermomonas sp.]|uniref:efflux RND transporter periplasmic adaptor subunit n=1 Tax=Thermomonas sp. TaxID=1971895 RepID=UPI002488A867|nr:efflux RND transporter periplasmic adaptor subunit [Thermomonas sp.]MDI1253387.1 efflux RND transporter periplasmic adaptor subunit [Thermomonas sp.]